MGDPPRHPWVNIASGVSRPRSAMLTWAEATETSPCATCSTVPCCTFMPLDTFRVSNIEELDYARYLLNFNHIELGVASNGEWAAYYKHPCRFLDRDNFGCRIHGKPEQP